MLTVSRYLLREFLTSSTAVLLAFLITWIAADTLVHIDDLASGVGDALRSVLDRGLDILPLGVPMACTVGAVWSITRAVRYREITAIRCGGIPLRSALLPILIASVLLGAGLAYFEDRVMIKGGQDRGEETQSDRPLPVKKNGHWWYSTASSVFVAESYDEEQGQLLGVTYFQMSDQGSILQRIEAAVAAHVEDHVWEFRDALLRDFSAGGVSSRQEESLQLDLGLSGGDLASARRPVSEETLNGLAQRMRDETGDDLIALEARFHERLAQPFAVLVLVLLAIPYAIGDLERGDSFARALLLTLGAASLFWLMWSLALLAAQSGRVAPAIPLWTVTLGFLALATWRFQRVRE
jgi:lipopolysaccharide export system permease protein